MPSLLLNIERVSGDRDTCANISSVTFSLFLSRNWAGRLFVCKPTGGASRCRLLLGFRQEKDCATWLVSHDCRCRLFQQRHFSLPKAPSQFLLSVLLFLGLYVIPPLVSKSPQGCLWSKPEFPLITWKIIFPVHLIFFYALVFCL